MIHYHTMVIDLETTGLLRGDTQDPKLQPGICQVCVFVVDQDWKVVDTYNQIVNPEMPIPDDAARIHKITNDRVKGAPSINEVYWDLVKFAQKSLYWSGFNTEFDRGVLWYQLMRYNLASRFPWPPTDIDLMQIAKPYLNLPGKYGPKPPKLAELHKHLFGMEFANAHDAFADVEATVRCGQKMKELGWL